MKRSPSSTGKPLSRRLRRERRTVEVMIRLYCRDNHLRADGLTSSTANGSTGTDQEAIGRRLCASCDALLAYSDHRVHACRFGAEKPTCAHCTVHCFRPQMREQIRAVMRYSGPRMTLRHPYLAVRHLLDRRRTPGD